MRPFKFFFAASVVAILALFMLRVLFAALVLAVIFSSIYFVLRSLAGFFHNLRWDGRSEREFEHFAYHRRQSKYSEPLFEHRPAQGRHAGFERIIRIH